MTIVYTSHYMEEVEELCERVGIIDHGKLIALGTKDELRKLVGDEDVIDLELDHVPTARTRATAGGRRRGPRDRERRRDRGTVTRRRARSSRPRWRPRGDRRARSGTYTCASRTSRACSCISPARACGTDVDVRRTASASGDEASR